MTSKLARAQIESWWAEGLHPTVDDIIMVNNLGLAVERGSEMYAFSACPRTAFLGDYVLREPTVAKRIWIDCASALFPTSVETTVYLVAYALGTPDAELPDVSKARAVQKAILKYRDEVLMHYTDTQILAAIDWCMNGNKPEINIDLDNAPGSEQPADITEVPGDTHSVAKQVLLEAIAQKIDPEVGKYALLEDLEKMVLVAGISGGSDVIKNEHTKHAGRFYVACGKTHERLVAERDKSKKA